MTGVFGSVRSLQYTMMLGLTSRAPAALPAATRSGDRAGGGGEERLRGVGRRTVGSSPSSASRSRGRA